MAHLPKQSNPYESTNRLFPFYGRTTAYLIPHSRHVRPRPSSHKAKCSPIESKDPPKNSFSSAWHLSCTTGLMMRRVWIFSGRGRPCVWRVRVRHWDRLRTIRDSAYPDPPNSTTETLLCCTRSGSERQVYWMGPEKAKRESLRHFDEAIFINAM